jgi:hypothetical protein
MYPSGSDGRPWNCLLGRHHGDVRSLLHEYPDRGVIRAGEGEESRGGSRRTGQYSVDPQWANRRVHPFRTTVSGTVSGRIWPRSAAFCHAVCSKYRLLKERRPKKLFRLLAGASGGRTIDRDSLFSHSATLLYGAHWPEWARFAPVRAASFRLRGWGRRWGKIGTQSCPESSSSRFVISRWPPGNKWM